MDTPELREGRPPGEPWPAVADASSHCPACSRKLEPRGCKLICPVCGYYMSCSDFY